MRETDQIRISKIYRMLLEISEGRFSQRIERTDEDDEIEAIAILVNMMAEEIQQTLKYYNLLNSPESIFQFVQMILILDSDFKITYINQGVVENLDTTSENLIGSSFAKLLSTKSRIIWQEVANELLISNKYHCYKMLRFTTGMGLVKEEMCSITSMYIEQDKKVYTLVSSFQTKTQGQFIEEGIITSIQSARNKPAKKFTSPNILKNEHDIEIIQQIHDYILRHLELPLPTLQVLAHNFGTNEYKLKYGFKQLYNTTVFKFLIDERLKKSNLLIENTTLSLNRIATLCGFKSIPHFSKAFKMKYGCSPSAYRNLSKWQ